jgi:hypothetical protein
LSQEAVRASEAYRDVAREARDRAGEADALSQLRRWFDAMQMPEEAAVATAAALKLALDDSRRLAPHLDPLSQLRELRGLDID